MLPHFLRLFQFNTWASQKAYDSLATCPEVPAKGVELLSHILQNQWYVRDLLLGADATRWYGVPDYTFAECLDAMQLLEAVWKGYIEEMSETRLSARVSYTDYEGKHVTRVTSDLLFHMLDHCTYHRGQIAMIVRQAGGEPAKTWFNRWVSETSRGEY